MPQPKPLPIKAPVRGTWLRELRECSGLTLDEVSALAGERLYGLSRIERSTELVPAELSARIVTAILALRAEDRDRWTALCADKSYGVMTHPLTGQTGAV